MERYPIARRPRRPALGPALHDAAAGPVARRVRRADSTAGDVVAWAGAKGLFGNAVTVGVNDIRFKARLTDAFHGKPTTMVAAIEGPGSNAQVEALRKVLANRPTPTSPAAK